MHSAKTNRTPEMSDAGLAPTHPVIAVDEFGNSRETFVAGERPLTLYLNKRELVTLMTLGGYPELLALGYLKNQGLVRRVEDLVSVQVDWDVEAAAVTTHEEIEDLDARLAHRTVTTGCGQGTIFGDFMEGLDQIRLPRVELRQSAIYALLHALKVHNQVYKQAGAVHGCALCEGSEILMFVEDVGRHNAVDAIAGHMWLEGTEGGNKIFYTTGRLTSEMVIKVAQMGVPILLSRSGITAMGLELARKVGVIMIARAKGHHFLVYNGIEDLVFDAPPTTRRTAPPSKSE
jgi:FdhD protein